MEKIVLDQRTKDFLKQALPDALVAPNRLVVTLEAIVNSLNALIEASEGGETPAETTTTTTVKPVETTTTTTVKPVEETTTTTEG